MTSAPLELTADDLTPSAVLAVPGIAAQFRDSLLQSAFDAALDGVAPGHSEAELFLHFAGGEARAYVVGAQRLGDRWSLTEILGVTWRAATGAVPEAGFRVRWSA